MENLEGGKDFIPTLQFYKQDYEALTRMALNLEVAERIIAEQPDKKRIVYAPACFLDEEYMESNQIEFVSIPYNLFQRKG